MPQPISFDKLLEYFKSKRSELGKEPKPTPSGLGLIANDPLNASKGIFTAIPDIASSIANSTMKGVSALLPGSVSEYINKAPRNILGIPASGEKTEQELLTPIKGFSPSQRATGLITAVSFGANDAIANRIRIEEEENPSNSPSDVAWNALKGIAASIGKDLLPGQQIEELLTGKSLTGYDQLGQPIYQPLTSEGAGKALTFAALKIVPNLSAAAALRNSFLLKKRLALTAKANARPGITPEQITANNIKALMSPEAADKMNPIDSPSRGEINALKAKFNASKEATLRSNIINNPTLKGLPKAVLEQVDNIEAQELGTTRVLSDPHIREIFAKTIESDVFQKIAEQSAERASTTGVVNPITQNVADAIRLNALDPEYVLDFARTVGLSGNDLPNLTNTLAESVLFSETVAGKIHQVASEASQVLHWDMLDKAKAGDPNAIKFLRDTAKAKEVTVDGHYMFWSGANRFLKLEESARKTIMTTTVQNTIRDLTSQAALVTPIMVAETATSKVLQSFVREGRITPRLRDVKEWWHEGFVNYVEGMASGIKSERANNKLGRPAHFVDELNNLMPRNAHRLDRAYVTEIHSQVLANTFSTIFPNIKKFAKDLITSEATGPRGALGLQDIQAVGKDISLSSIAEGAARALELANTPRQIQEHFNRRTISTIKLYSNLKAIGYKDVFGTNGKLQSTVWQQVMKDLRKDKLDPQVRAAFVDAELSGLTNTFAADPIGGPAGSIVKIFQDYPVLGLVTGFPFPRFMANAFRFLTERSPVAFLDVLTPEFRNAIVKEGMEGVLARDRLSKAWSGIGLMAAAFALRNDEFGLAGPKYYQIKVGDELEDIRNVQPFASMLGFMEAFKNYLTGKPNNFSANDILEMTTNVRNPSESPIWAFPEILRALSSNDPDVVNKAWQSPIGQYFASWFGPLNNIKVAKAMLEGDKQSLTSKDTTYNKLLGPAAERIPGMDKELPLRYNPTTGKPITKEYPGAWMLGANISNSDQFGRFTQKLGMTHSDFIGQHDSVEANQLVAKHMGQILSKPVELDGFKGLRKDYIMKEILEGNWTQATQVELLRKYLEPIRESAVKQAIQENKTAFVKSKTSQQPIHLRESTRRKERQRLFEEVERKSYNTQP